MSSRGRIIQDDFVAAFVAADDEDRMMDELLHYAAVYEQDGPVKVEVRNPRGRWVAIAQS